jgi:transposase-like protein
LKEEPLMKRVFEIGKDVKTRKAKARRQKVKELMGIDLAETGTGLKLQLIQDLIPLALIHVGEVLKEEVRFLAGQRYQRDSDNGYVRWSRQWGSIYLGGQKVPVVYQRVRDKENRKEIDLNVYKALQEPRDIDETLLGRILLGLSCRDYRKCSEMIPETFGLSASTVSRRFIKASSRKLKELKERRLEHLDLVGLVIDGKAFENDEMIIALGVTTGGRKVILGFVQTATENASVCKDFLNELLDRGLRIEDGVLCVMDGSKGLRKAVEGVFGRYALIQRCQWHKRENVLRYLAKQHQLAFRSKLQRAYQEPTYEKAKAALVKMKKELALMNESAVRSLEEGLEETLTLHRLGLFEKLGKSLKTSNSIESVMSLIEQRTQKVDYWKNSNQKQRWLATALLEIEPRLNRIKGYTHLPQLRTAIQRELTIISKQDMAA